MSVHLFVPLPPVHSYMVLNSFGPKISFWSRNKDNLNKENNNRDNHNEDNHNEDNHNENNHTKDNETKKNTKKNIKKIIWSAFFKFWGIVCPL